MATANRNFSYTARDNTGKIVKGKIEASNEAAVTSVKATMM